MKIFKKLLGKINKSFHRLNASDGEIVDGIHKFNGKRHTGSVFRCWPKGNLMFETEVKDGLDHGKSHMFKTNGSIFGIINYKNGELEKADKEIELKFSAYLKKYLEAEFKKYKKIEKSSEKVYHEFHKNGRIKFEVDILDGSKNGFLKEWNESGQIIHEQLYANDVLDGLCKRWFDNGQLRYEGNFKKGKKDGLIKEWFSNGRLQYEMHYKKGEYDGDAKKWYENGNLLYEQTYVNGVVKEIKSYKENGDFISHKIFDNHGKEIEEVYKEYFENGNVKIEGVLKLVNDITDKFRSVDRMLMRDGFFKFYHENGKLHKEGNFVSDVQDGLWKIYFPNGKIHEECNWKIGDQDGKCKLYWENGNLRASMFYRMGSLHNSFKQYFENGNIHIEGRFNEGIPKFMKEYDENGQLKGEVQYDKNGNKIN